MRNKILILCACVLTVPAAVTLYLRGFFLPSWVQWKEAEITGDFDLDGKEETMRTARKSVYLMQGEDEIQLLPGDWLAADLQSGDIDRDGRQEILIIVFSRRNYGDYRPFWEEEDREQFYQHLYIYHYENGKLKPFWMSSRLRPEFRDMLVKEDGMLEMTDTAGEKSVWQWKTWGLERTDK